MSPDSEGHGRKKRERMSGTARLHRRSYMVYGGGLEFARQRKRDKGLKKAAETEVRQEELKGRRGNKVRR